MLEDYKELEKDDEEIKQYKFINNVHESITEALNRLLYDFDHDKFWSYVMYSNTSI